MVQGDTCGSAGEGGRGGRVGNVWLASARCAGHVYINNVRCRCIWDENVEGNQVVKERATRVFAVLAAVWFEGFAHLTGAPDPY